MECSYKGHTARLIRHCLGATSYDRLKQYPPSADDTSKRVFHVNAGTLPNHIRSVHVTKYSSLMMKSESTNTVAKKCRIAVVMVFILSLIALATALTLLKIQNSSKRKALLLESDNVQYKNDPQHPKSHSIIPMGRKSPLVSKQNGNTESRIQVITKHLQSENNGLYCMDVCRQYSAFRFRSACVGGQCKCNGNGYQSHSCLPIVRGCQISKKSPATLRARFQHSTQTVFSCRDGHNEQSGVHVFSNFGNKHTGSTYLTLSDSRRKSNITSVILVLANYQKVKWNIKISRGEIRLKKIYLISNKNLKRSNVVIDKDSHSSLDEKFKIEKIFSHVGYGDDKYGGHTRELLETIYSDIGGIQSFSGTSVADHWSIDLKDQSANRILKNTK